MPNTQRISEIIRNDVLAQLRTTDRPMTTEHIRRGSGRIPVPGTNVQRQPILEQVYRVLRRLRDEEQVVSIATPGRNLQWLITDKGAAAEEIAALNALLAAPTAEEPVRFPTVGNNEPGDRINLDDNHNTPEVP